MRERRREERRPEGKGRLGWAKERVWAAYLLFFLLSFSFSILH
jgi:hypothetical protein